MGQRELLLMIGAIMIFGITVLTTNQYVVDQNEAALRREFEYYSISLAQSYIEEGKTKAFDANVIDASPLVPSGFTGSGALGPEAGEVYPGFDDVDDFNGLTAVDSTKRSVFYASIQVGYVQEADPETVVGTKTFYKKMTVSVTDSSYMDSPAQLSYVFGYMKN
ncbi:MAG: hypothetical protein ACE5HO_10110 [bacterium]